ncbi:type IV pilus assembly protein PilM [Angustibacter sp. McL0619]|uniref:type IV pilus assembly protein PilM n=1 Tax=Angustibacter sp. McL0619 TaxID=3415676 RepID=UPI003CFA1A30
MAGRSAIGLDIGTSGVRAAELSFGKQGVTLEKFGQVALPEGAVRDGEVVDVVAVSHALKQLWAHTGFSHKEVVLGVANQRVIVRQVELPALPEKELKASLAFQVQDFLPMPVEQAVLDFHPVEEYGDAGQPRMMRGLLVAAVREMVLSNVNAVQRAGLRVTSVDLTSFAVLRSLGSFGAADSDAVALVDVGSRVTNIVVHRAGVPLFVRILLMGGQDVTDAVADTLGMTRQQAEALKQAPGLSGIDHEQQLNAGRALEATAASFVDEVRSSLDYYASSAPAGGTLKRVVLSGGGSRLHGLAQRLEAATRLPVSVGNPLSSVSIGRTGLSDEQIEFVQPLVAVPVGLALGADR